MLRCATTVRSLDDGNADVGTTYAMGGYARQTPCNAVLTSFS